MMIPPYHHFYFFTIIEDAIEKPDTQIPAWRFHMKKAQKEISFTEGSVFRSLIRFALPVLGALILQAAYGAVDLLVVGQFGDAASISAIGTGSVFTQMLTAVITSLAMGTTVTVGRHIGEGKPKEAGDAIGTTILLFAALGIVLTLFLEIFAGNIAALLQVPEEATAKAVLYIRICSGGLLIIIAYNVISSILRGFGNSNLPFLFVGIACAVNIAGDLLLVGVFDMDVAGAAIATVLAQTISVIASVLVLCRYKLPISFSMKQCRLFRTELRQLLWVGMPIAIQETMVQISFLVVNSVVNGMGLVQSAGYGVAQKIITFIMLVPSAFMQSVSAFVAQNAGAGKPERARKGLFTSILTGSILGSMIFTASVFGGEWLSALFTKDSEVITEGAAYLRGFALDCVLSCTLFSIAGYFNGLGKSFPVMVQGLTSALLFRIPLSILFSRLPGSSLTLVGAATPITSVYGILFFLICFAVLKHTEKKAAVNKSVC